MTTLDEETTAKPKTRLFLRKITSVGLVDAGACEGSDVLLFKRATDDPEDGRDPKVLRRLKVRFASLVDAPANPGATVAMFKRHAPTGDSRGRPGGPIAKRQQIETERAAARRHFDGTVRDIMARQRLGRGDATRVALRDHEEMALAAGLDPKVIEAHRAAAPEEKREVTKMAEPTARDTAWRVIQQAGAEIRRQSPDLTEQQAIAKALEENPGLYGVYADRDAASMGSASFAARKRFQAHVLRRGYVSVKHALWDGARKLAKSSGMTEDEALAHMRRRWDGLAELADAGD